MRICKVCQNDLVCCVTIFQRLPRARYEGPVKVCKNVLVCCVTLFQRLPRTRYGGPVKVCQNVLVCCVTLFQRLPGARYGGPVKVCQNVLVCCVTLFQRLPGARYGGPVKGMSKHTDFSTHYRLRKSTHRQVRIQTTVVIKGLYICTSGDKRSIHLYKWR